MSKGYMWVAMEILEGLLKLPEGVHIEGVLLSRLHRGDIGLILSGDELPVGGEIISEVTPLFQTVEGEDFKFLEWQGAPK